MTIKKYTANKDNTISSAFKLNLSDRSTSSNMGASDILEIFSIYAQASSASLERSRVLVQFPVDEIQRDRTAGIIPASGSATFKLKVYNAEHGQTVPTGYTISAAPLVKSWTEGAGLDMESYLDDGKSNWHSASATQAWLNYGGDFLEEDYLNVSSISVPIEYTQDLDSGLESIDIDITPLVEEMLKYEAGTGIKASGSINFNLDSEIQEGEAIKIYAYNGEWNNFQFSNTSGSTGRTFFVVTGSTSAESVENFINTVAYTSSIASLVTIESVNSFETASITQGIEGFYGNTIISSSFDAADAIANNFAGGVGAPNYGLLLKLSGSYEDGTLGKSYYTKKFFARSSHHVMERPVIEVQWDSSIKDDRSNFFRSSSLATESENLNNIYLYNKRRAGYMDIPDTGSNLVVKFVPSLGGTPVSITGNNTSGIYVTASKHTTGIYKASFAYAGTETSLRDVWVKDVYTSETAGVAASASIEFTSVPLSDETFTLTDTSAATASFIVLGGVSTNDGSQDGSGNFIVGRAALADTEAFVTRLSEVITAQTDIGITSTTDGTTLNLVQDVTGSDGNTTINLGSFTGASLSEGTGFQGGVTFVAAYNTYTELYTGSGFTVRNDLTYSHYEVPDYVTSITNLKAAYTNKETATFRIYTRNKNWKPNIYTVANQSAPVDTIRDGYYKIARVSDDFVVIPYSTSSTPSFSSLSYDMSGSYFDLDMSILEPNYLYEISFLYKDGTDYIEQKEKFKFRVD